MIKTVILTPAQEVWANRILGGKVRAALLAGDASFRRYFRVAVRGQTFIFMDSPPPEDLSHFLAARRFFEQGGVSVPSLIAADEERHWALLEDFGDAVYNDAVKRGDDVQSLYTAAWRALILMQKLPLNFSPLYDARLLHNEMELFVEWHCAHYLQMPLQGAELRDFAAAAAWLSEEMQAQPQVVVHRDFHSRNLMRIAAARNPGVLDFQDTVIGAAAYDMVSLLRDAYLAWPAAQQKKWLQAYWREATAAGVPLPPTFAQFWRDFNIAGAQRGLKVLGIFARLWGRDGKRRYLQDMPLVRRHLFAACRALPELRALQAILRRRPLPPCK